MTLLGWWESGCLLMGAGWRSSGAVIVNAEQLMEERANSE